jgi:hypothetical protein
MKRNKRGDISRKKVPKKQRFAKGLVKFRRQKRERAQQHEEGEKAAGTDAKGPKKIPAEMFRTSSIEAVMSHVREPLSIRRVIVRKQGVYPN